MSIIERGVSKSIRIFKRTVFKRNAPDFIIAGAQKSGTSSLYYYLSQHPNLSASMPKEVRYFDRDDNFNKGKIWYERSFINLNSNNKDCLFFEATPEYMYRSFATERMHEQYPDLKIILILRNPVKRAYSAWNMYRDFLKLKKLPGKIPSKNGYINDRQNNLAKEFYKAEKFPSFEEAITSEILKIEQNSELEEPSLLRRGIHLTQIKRFHDLFGKEKVLILGFADLIQNKKNTLNEILRFLNLKESDWDFLKDEPKNSRDYPERMSKEMEDKLKAFYTPYNDALFDYLGTKINW